MTLASVLGDPVASFPKVRAGTARPGRCRSHLCKQGSSSLLRDQACPGVL